MEGVRIFDFEQIGVTNIADAKKVAEHDLKQTLEGLANHIFTKGHEVNDESKLGMRWVGENFPFTDPSLELEIFYKNDWMEV